MQRIFITSLARAKRLAKELQSEFDTTLDRDLTLSNAKTAIARMLGYDSYTELKRVTERHDHEPSLFDELLTEEDLQKRLEEQDTVLSRDYGVEPYQAAWIVARLRLTAHPAGPHHLEGPSSIIGTPSLEYRGHAPGRYEPLMLRDGVFYESILASQDIPAMKKLTVEESEKIVASTKTKIFARLKEMEQSGELAEKSAGVLNDLPDDRPQSSPFLIILDDRGYHASTDKEIAEMRGTLTPRMGKRKKEAKPLDRVERTPMECLEAADVSVIRTKNGFQVVARMPLPEGMVLASWVKIDGKRRFAVPRTNAVIIEPGQPEDIVEGDYTLAPEQSVGRPNWFDDNLRRCGLHTTVSDPFALETWRDLIMSQAADMPSLEDMNSAWERKVLDAGIPALRNRIDGTAIDLLSISSSDVLHDDHAYRFVRDIPSNAKTRSLLETYPMLFGEMWSSPEVMGDNLVGAKDMRKILMTQGLSRSIVSPSAQQNIPPMPQWLVDWFEGRRFTTPAFSFEDQGSQATHAAIRLLGLLGAEYAPATEKDWQAVTSLTTGFGGLFYMGEKWSHVMPAEAWLALLPGVDHGWSHAVEAIRAALPEGYDLRRALDHVWLNALDELGIEECDEDIVEQSSRLQSALTKMPLQEWAKTMSPRVPRLWS